VLVFSKNDVEHTHLYQVFWLYWTFSVLPYLFNCTKISNKMC